MNDVTFGFKLEQDRRGFEAEKTREALVDLCLPPAEHAPSSPAGEPVGAGQARSRQVKLEKFLQGAPTQNFWFQMVSA